MIKNYSQFNESASLPSTEEEIIKACKKFNINNYIINNDMSIDVDGSVSLNGSNFGQYPLKFNKISRNFSSASINLYSLENGPKEVGGYFSCADNKLISLEGMPHIIGGDIYCENNYIKSFKWIPDDFREILLCYNNPIDDIYNLFDTNVECIYWINEYDVIQGDNIILDRYEEVFHQLNMIVLVITEIENYNLI